MVDDVQISQAEMARRLNITPQALNKLLKRGKVRGRLPNGKVDAVVAWATYHQNVRQYNSPGKATSVANSDSSIDVRTSRQVREQYEALQKKAEYEKFISELIPLKQVEQVLSARAGEIRDRLLTIADRLAPVLVDIASADEVHRVIFHEIEESLKRLGDQIVVEQLVTESA